MKNIILFDLGGTLAKYYEKAEFPDILKRAIVEVENYLAREGICRASLKEVWQRVKEEDQEAKDYSVRPLEDRLTRIFQLNRYDISVQLMDSISRCFMKPIFAIAKIYEDTFPILDRLRSYKYRQAIVSNTPWGSPSNLWREEIRRLGLSDYMEASFFCRDVGWRKPAKQIFDFVLEKLNALPQDCIFVGDDPRWDLAGPKTVGIEAIIINRKGKIQNAGDNIINNLYELINEIKRISHSI